MLGISPRRALRAERQADTLEQTHQVERIVDPHIVEHFIGREVVDMNNQPLAQRAEFFRQPRKGLLCHDFDIGEGRRGTRAPVGR